MGLGKVRVLMIPAPNPTCIHHNYKKTSMYMYIYTHHFSNLTLIQPHCLSLATPSLTLTHSLLLLSLHHRRRPYTLFVPLPSATPLKPSLIHASPSTSPHCHTQLLSLPHSATFSWPHSLAPSFMCLHLILHLLLFFFFFSWVHFILIM